MHRRLALRQLHNILLDAPPPLGPTYRLLKLLLFRRRRRYCTLLVQLAACLLIRHRFLDDVFWDRRSDLNHEVILFSLPLTFPVGRQVVIHLYRQAILALRSRLPESIRQVDLGTRTRVGPDGYAEIS